MTVEAYIGFYPPLAALRPATSEGCPVTTPTFAISLRCRSISLTRPSDRCGCATYAWQQSVACLPCPILLWSDATGTNEGESAPQIAFVARFPGGIPAPSDPPGLTPIYPRWVHSAMVVPPHVLSELEARKQQIGQLELLAAIVGY